MCVLESTLCAISEKDKNKKINCAMKTKRRN